jgi:hypothetical protein
MRDFEYRCGTDAAMDHPSVADEPVVMDERIAALMRRYASDAAFRGEVDDLVAATGLLLPEPNTSLGTELDDVIALARYKRAVRVQPR